MPANRSDIKLLPKLSKRLFGNLFGDKGYLSESAFEQLFQHGVQLITKLKSTMKSRLIPLRISCCCTDALLSSPSPTNSRIFRGLNRFVIAAHPISVSISYVGLLPTVTIPRKLRFTAIRINLKQFLIHNQWCGSLKRKLGDRKWDKAVLVGRQTVPLNEQVKQSHCVG